MRHREDVGKEDAEAFVSRLKDDVYTTSRSDLGILRYLTKNFKNLAFRNFLINTAIV